MFSGFVTPIILLAFTNLLAAEMAGEFEPADRQTLSTQDLRSLGMTFTGYFCL